MGTWHVRAVADEDFEPVSPAPGMEIARVISKGSESDLGGGIIRYVQDADLKGWTLGFDELLYVLDGEILITPADGESFLVAAGETVVLAHGVTVDCSGVAGTRLLFALYPRHLTEGPANAAKYGRPD